MRILLVNKIHYVRIYNGCCMDSPIIKAFTAYWMHYIIQAYMEQNQSRHTCVNKCKKLVMWEFRLDWMNRICCERRCRFSAENIGSIRHESTVYAIDSHVKGHRMASNYLSPSIYNFVFYIRNSGAVEWIVNLNMRF